MILLLALLGMLSSSSAIASDRVLDFSAGCKIYKLDGKNWREIDATPFAGFGLSNTQILKDEKFTVFKTEAGTYGVNQKCMKAGIPDASRPDEISEPRSRSSGFSDSAGRSEWAVAFSLGMNLSPTGNIVSTVAGTAGAPIPQKFKNSVSFMGGATYRFKPNFRLSAEIGLSQLSTDTMTGNETSFFDVSPELMIRMGRKIELHVGPNLGLFFFSQNAQTDAVYSIKQQSASSILLGANLGADYALGNQFDLGLFLQYFKPGALKITATRISDSASTESALSTSYWTLGSRFTIHF